MGNASKVQFEPKWKEELVCTLAGKTFVIELTMGILTVYFPTKSKWESCAPQWAWGKWDQVKEDLCAWCKEQKMPLKIQDDAWVEFD